MPEEARVQQDAVQEWARKALLYDFYSPLLTEKQCRIWDSYYLKDYSLTEIARIQCTSRQAVHSLLQRTQESLEMYEAKMRLIERFLTGREYLLHADRRLQTLSAGMKELPNAGARDKKLRSEVTEIRASIQRALDTY